MKDPILSRLYPGLYSQLIIFHIIIFFITLPRISFAQSDCPRFCSICLRNTLICENSGFLEFPTKFQSTTENITLIGHHFTSNIISAVNMTGLQGLKIFYLAIRSSSIQEIYSRTFSSLISLNTLDLSENQILKVHNLAFDGLNLHTLKLNDIGKLKLFPNSFSKLKVRVLSIVNSRLGILEYDVFQSIDLSVFQSLQIANNNFRTIDQRFEYIFSKLTQVNLIGNPFVCNCSLLWLKRLSSLVRSGMFEIEFPKCVSPSVLRNRQLPEILESEFKCHRPKINEIGIHFKTLYIADLICQVDTHKTRTHKTNVMWVVNSHKSRIVKVRSQGVAYLRVTKSEFKSPEYQCIAENNIGNSSIIVFLEWPSNMNVYKTNLTVPIDYSSNLDGFSWTSSYYFKRRYTLVELIVAVISSFISTILLFLITYRICVQTKVCPSFSKMSHLQHHKSQSHSKVLISRYPPLHNNFGTDNALHSVDSNSQTYDCISIGNAIYPHQLLAHTSHSLQGQFIDYKTHERLYTTQLDR